MLKLGKDYLQTFETLDLKDPDNTKRIVSEIEDSIRIDDRSILCNSGQLWVFYEMALGLHTDNNGWIFEFGTYRGGSAGVLGSGLKHSQSPFTPMVTIDNNTVGKDREFATKQTITREVVHQLGLDEHVATVTFEDLRFFQSFLSDKPIQFILHDSNPTNHHAYQFLNACFPKVITGGWIGVHDYVHRDEGSNVIADVNRFLNEKGDKVKPYRILWDSLVLLNKLSGDNK